MPRIEATTTVALTADVTTRPAWLRPVADRIGARLLQRDIRRRLDAFARACADAELVALVRAQWAARGDDRPS